MSANERFHFLDNLRTFSIFLVVLVHAGMVYESSGLMAPFWIVDDPATSKLPGLVNLVLDLFVMPTIFFVSGFLAPSSLDRKGAARFLASKLRRLMIPWLLAVLTLIPLYKVIFLYSRGLAQESWTTYLHFSNGLFGMSWLWFLPVLFIFDVLYALLRSLEIPTERMPSSLAVGLVLALSFTWSTATSLLDWIGWTKTPLVDFQNERLLPHFLVFLLGALFYRKKILAARDRKLKLYIAVNATVWIPINLYVITLLSFLFSPGEPIVSERVDLFVLWSSFHVSVLALLYIAVTTFRYFLDRRGRLSATLSRSSYGVYVLHVVVLGLVALALLGVDLPALVKYPLLAVTTWIGSNLLVWSYSRAVVGLRVDRGAAVVSAG